MTVFEEQAARLVAEADPGRVAAYYSELQASPDPASLAAAVAFRLDPIVDEARGDVDRLRASVAAAEQRLLTLERLSAAAQAVALGVAPDDHERGVVVAGQEIARAAVECAIDHGRSELGYREWFQLFRSDGYIIESADPLAVFLTALTRSDRVERVGERTGVYRIAEEASVSE